MAEQVKNTNGQLDKDKLDLMREKDFIASVETDKGFKRFFLNATAEILGVLEQLSADFERLNNIFVMAFSKQIAEFYKTTEKNVKEEEKTQKTMSIIEKSHKKSKKLAK